MKYGQLCEWTSDTDFPTFIANACANNKEEEEEEGGGGDDDDVRPCNSAAYCLVPLCLLTQKHVCGR